MELSSLENFNLTKYSIPFIPVGIIMFAVGLVVLLSRPKAITHITFFLTLFTISMWQFSNGLGYSVQDPDVALVVFKITWFAIILLAPSTYSFIASILDLKNKAVMTIIAFLCFLPFLWLLATDLFLTGVYEYRFGYDVSTSWLIVPFILLFLGWMGLSLVVQYKALKNAKITKIKKKQIRLVFIGELIALLGLVDFLPTLGVDFYPIGFIPATICITLLTIAILKYRLFSITHDIAASAVLDVVGDILFITDLKGKVLITNKVTLKFLGVNRNKVVGRSILNLMPDAKNILSKVQEKKYRKSLIAADQETLLKVNEDEKINISLTANVIKAQRTPIGIVFICQDIENYIEARKAREMVLRDANKKGEELVSKVGELEDLKKSMLNVLEDLNTEKSKLQEAKAKDEAVLLAIGDGLIVSDSGGEIVMVNKAFEMMLGWKASEVIGKPITNVVKMEDEKGKAIEKKERANPLLLIPGKKITPTRTSYLSRTETYYYVRKNKERFPVTITWTPIVLNKKIIGAVEVFRDVTREKDIDRAKSEFVSLASHQLRTPLSTISWYTEMLLAGDVGKLNKDQQKYMDQVYEANKRMIDLVNALLNVSRIELGTFMVEPEPTKIVEVAEGALAEVKPQIIEKSLKIVKNYDKDIPVIQADPKLLLIVFQNLISNAVKYTPEKGRVSIDIKLTEDKKNIFIKVEDTGYGIPKDQQNRIFSKLFRADNVKARDTKGTGLGLYIVKSIVDNAKGKIWFESEEDKGTKFFVEIPVKGMKKKEGSRQLT